VNEDVALCWRTLDPAGVRDRLAAIGLAPRGGDRLGCPGLVVTVERARDERLEVLRAADPRDAPPSGEQGTTGGALRLLAVGLATVDLERAAAALGGLVERLPDDALLGARAGRVGDPRIVLLEPATEGRLAASLARVGEGPVAIYLAVADAGTRNPAAAPASRPETTVAGPGPLGPQALVRAGPPWGPHLLLVTPAAQR
jgi:hypothetical protein